MERSTVRPEAVLMQPVVLAAVGASAIQTLAQLPRVADELGIRVAGPFGVVAIPRPHGPVTIDAFPWLSNMEVPREWDRTFLTAEAAPQAGPGVPPSAPDAEVADGSRTPPPTTEPVSTSADDAALVAELTALFRRLRLDQPTISPDTRPRRRVGVYLVMDLTDPEIVAAGLRLARLMRTADPTFDLTGLVLTGCTATSQPDPGEPWFNNFATLVAALQPEMLLQRLYILDGRDANNAAWFQSPLAMQRQGAEFLLHHGLSPQRDHLRRSERHRISTDEDFLSVCGAFCCRTLRLDRAAVARGVAARLSREDLAALDTGVLCMPLDSHGLEQEAQRLADAVVELCKGGDPGTAKTPGRSDPGSPGPARTSPSLASSSKPPSSAQVAADLEPGVLAEIRQTLIRVCAEQPVVNLRRFFTCLRPRLSQLATSSALADRAHARYRIAEQLRDQTRETYRPVQRWIALAEEPGLGSIDVEWTGCYQPEVRRCPKAKVSRPASPLFFLLGLAVVTLGLAGVAAAVLGLPPLLGGVGGLLAIGATLLMALPAGWVEREQVAIQEPANTPLPASARCCYRRSLPLGLALPGAGAVTVGLLLLGEFLPRPGWDTQASLSVLLGVLVWLVIVMAGSLGLVWPNDARQPHGAARHLDHHVGPPPWPWRIGGSVCLALAWLVLWTQTPVHVAPGDTWSLARLVGGTLLVVTGIACLRWPVQGRAVVFCVIPKKPGPLRPDVAPPEQPAMLQQLVVRLAAWLEALAPPAATAPSASAVWPAPHSPSTLLEALVDDWDERLANLFRAHLANRGQGGSLLEMSRRPEAWADCILEELKCPTGELGDPTYLFALHFVKQWAAAEGPERLVAKLDPDPQWLDLFIRRVCAPHWPPTRREPEVDASVTTVGSELWPLVEPVAAVGTEHRFYLAPWLDHQTLVIVRVVQGLWDGWQNLPPLPTSWKRPRDDDNGVMAEAGPSQTTSPRGGSC